MTTGYERVTGMADLFARAGDLAVKTMIFDIEPLIAPWNSSQQALDRGIAQVLSQVKAVPSVRAVVFSTNSARRPSAVPAGDGLEVRYLASAGKPLRTAPYRDLPRPGAVIGDQLPTDGVLAYRLGYTFLHYPRRWPTRRSDPSSCTTGVRSSVRSCSDGRDRRAMRAGRGPPANGEDAKQDRRGGR